MRYPIPIMTLAALVTSASAQSVDPNNAFAWGENIGFLNFDAVDESNPEHFVIFDDHIAGFIWCENIGWLNFGPGGGPYVNDVGFQAGVNLDPMTGHLSGYAWSENTGWINMMGGALASTPNPARIEDNRFKGYAWSENTGWINLDDDQIYVGLLNCPADLTGEGQLNFLDVSAFLSAYGNMDPVADFEPDGSFNFLDVSAFLSAYAMGCP